MKLADQKKTEKDENERLKSGLVELGDNQERQSEVKNQGLLSPTKMKKAIKPRQNKNSQRETEKTEEEEEKVVGKNGGVFENG